MTETNSCRPESAETANTLRFLHRFADLMSSGSNSENLLRAASTLEAHIDWLKDTEQLLGTERAKAEARVEAHQALEARVGALQDEILALKSQLAAQQSHEGVVVAEMERRQSELLLRAEAAEARLAAVEALPPAIASGSIAVPLSTLQVAKAQFEAFALAFEKSGNIVSQVMCEASASALDRAILDASPVEEEDYSRYSQYAA
jgi:hypothetical protein